MATDKSFGCRFANTEKCADSCFNCELFHRDYISREAAISEILAEPTDAHYPSWYADKLKQIPAADVRPVVEGKLVNPYMEEYYGEWYHCSVCGTGGLAPGDNFCSNCGADMREVTP